MVVITTVAFVCTFSLVSSKLLQEGQEKRNIGQERGKAEVMCDLICNVGSTCSKAKILWIQGICDCITDVSHGLDDVDEAPTGSLQTGSHPCAKIQYRELASVGLCIKFVLSSVSYKDARALCEAENGGRVANLDTKAKIATVETIHRTEYGRWKFYIGLTREGKGDFRWTGGALLTDANWATGQPTKNPGDYCVVSTVWFKYKWDDVFCLDKCGVICEVVF